MKRTTLFAVTILLLAAFAECAPAVFMPKPGWEGANHFLTEANFEHPRLLAYLSWLSSLELSITKDVEKNLKNYILMNPNVTSSREMMQFIGFFILIIQGTYLLAIVATAAYLLLLSGSPKQRVNAKNMLGKLVVGLILVTLSPQVMQILLDLTSIVSAYVLDHSNTDITVNRYNDVIHKSTTLTKTIILGPIGVTDMVFHWSIFKYGPIEKALKVFHGKWFEFIETGAFKFVPRPEFTFPLLMTELLFVFTLYGMLALRYFMMTLWVILFPFTIFLYSFEPTKGIGKNMIEQTLFWSIVQVMFAVNTAVIATGFEILPEGFEFFGLGSNWLPFSSISFFTISGCIILLLTPIILLILSQRLLA